MLALGGMLVLSAATACRRGDPMPPPEAVPCDKTVDNCPAAPVAGQTGDAPTTVSPPPGDPSQNNPAAPPGRPPR